MVSPRRAALVEFAGHVGGVIREDVLVAGLARFAQGEFGSGDAAAAGGGAVFLQKDVGCFALAVLGQDQWAAVIDAGSLTQPIARV